MAKPKRGRAIEGLGDGFNIVGRYLANQSPAVKTSTKAVVNTGKATKKTGSYVADEYLAAKEIKKIVSGKGGRKDVASAATKLGSLALPYGKAFKGVDAAIKGGKGAKVVRGAVKAGIGYKAPDLLDSAIKKGVNVGAPKTRKKK